MRTKESIIQGLINDNGYKSYLELGYQNGASFNPIKAETKVSVDINGKADYNDGDLEFLRSTEDQFDLIFVDSHHEAEHVREVIIESMKVLSDNGCIVLHDSIPYTFEMQEVPRKQKEWTGNIWRSLIGFHTKYPDVRFETYNIMYGLTVIYPEGAKKRAKWIDYETTFEDFQANKVELLNIIY